MNADNSAGKQQSHKNLIISFSSSVSNFLSIPIGDAYKIINDNKSPMKFSFSKSEFL